MYAVLRVKHWPEGTAAFQAQAEFHLKSFSSRAADTRVLSSRVEKMWMSEEEFN